MVDTAGSCFKANEAQHHGVIAIIAALSQAAKAEQHVDDEQQDDLGLRVNRTAHVVPETAGQASIEPEAGE